MKVTSLDFRYAIYDLRAAPGSSREGREGGEGEKAVEVLPDGPQGNGRRKNAEGALVAGHVLRIGTIRAPGAIKANQG
jgi:hypothetical protein